MKIEVVLTEETFRRFTMFDLFRRKKVWRAPAIWAAILCTSAAICFVMSHVRGAVLLGWVLTIVGLGLPLSYFATFAQSMKNQVLASGLKRPKLVYTLVLTEKNKGIAVTNETEKAEYEWKQVHHAYRDTLATYLFITRDRAFILPNECVEEGEEELWKLLLWKLGALRCTDLTKKK